jgi:hypothetical protein
MYLQELKEMNLKPEEVVDYLRKSQTDDPSLSVEEILARHESILDNWAENHLGAKVAEDHKFREVVSGETLKERPAIQKLLRMIESPRIKAILCVDPQRLTRGDLEDIGRLMKLLQLTHTLIITPDEFGGQRIYNLNDEYDWDAFERELKKGNDYLKYVKKILNRGRILSVEAGNFVGNRAPYGYRRVTVMDGKKKCHTLEIIPDEAAVVKLIYKLYLEGMGSAKIADHLFALGIKTSQGKRWGLTTIRTILTNEHYVGKVRWYHKKTVKVIKDGEILVRRPTAEEYLLYPGKHPAIIDEETFNAAQTKRGQLPKHKIRTTLVNPLAGLLYCSCGMAMKYHSFMRHGVETAAPRFACSYQKHCEHASCTASEVLDSVKDTLRQALADLELRIEAGEDESLKIHQQLIKKLEHRLEELEALEIAQWDKYTQEGMPKHIFETLNAKVLAEKEEVQHGLCIAKDATPEPIDLQEKASTLRKALRMMDDPNASIPELNALLKTCINRITYSRPKAQGIASHWQTGNAPTLDVDLNLRK